jgi:hypothetical protein
MRDITLTEKERSQLSPCPVCGTGWHMYCEKTSAWDALVGPGYRSEFRVGCCCMDRVVTTRTQWCEDMIDAMNEWNTTIAGALDSEGDWQSYLPEVT